MVEVTLGAKKAAVLCLLVNKDKVLLLKRAKEPHLGKYIPVGGKIEPFESPQEAAKREIFEETNVKVDNLNFCGVMVETSPIKFNWINFIYISDVEHFEPTECNEGALSWEKLDSILDLPTPTTDWYIYKFIRENKPFMFNALYDKDLNLLKLEDEITNEILFRDE